MNNFNPFMYNPYQGAANQGNPNPQDKEQEKSKNSNTHFMMGLAAGAAVAYLLSNKKVQQSVAATGGKAWSAVRGEVEELKERLEDTQAELEYYRNLSKEK